MATICPRTPPPLVAVFVRARRDAASGDAKACISWECQPAQCFPAVHALAAARSGVTTSVLVVAQRRRIEHMISLAASTIVTSSHVSS